MTMADTRASDEKLTFTKPKRRKVYLLIGLVIVVLGVAIGLIVHFTVNNNNEKSLSTTQKEEEHKGDIGDVLIDCHPDEGADESKCTKRGCLWREQSVEGAPWCLYPEGHGYILNNPVVETNQGLEAEVDRINTPRVFNGDIYDKLVVSVEYQTSSRLRIKITPKGVSRYEVPQEALDIPSPNTPPSPETRLYEVSMKSGQPQFGIIVKRVGSNTTVFSTDLPGFTYTDQFLQITTRLPSDNLYGFGEHNHQQFKHDMNWKTWTMFTRDFGFGWGPVHLYGVHPMYLNLEEDGQATVVLLKNSNAMEVALQPNPNPAVTYRTIGGILDFYIFMGPTPEQAVQQYIETIGRPVMPPYWALGFHLCRWGYKDLEDMKMVIERNRAAGIPYDTQWGDIEYLFKKYLFTVDKTDWKNLPQTVDDLHQHHQRFIVIVDPAVGSDPAIIAEAKQNSPGYDMYDDGIQSDIFIKNASGAVLIAEVWPGKTAYPDFTNPNTEDYWLKWMNYFYNTERVEYDALWIDMNEPSSFIPGSIDGCPNTTWDYPPYVPHIVGAGPEGKMYDKTICMSSQQHWGRHYDVHSLYAHSHAITTYNSLLRQKPGIRPWTMTRSNFVGTGKYVTKWTGDNQSRWSHLHYSIVSIMEFSMFGFAMNGADICGFWYEAEYEMCLRWHQLGAFYPFARNHNGKGDDPVLFKHQDPAGWDQKFIDTVKPVLLTRYRLLPYFYSLMYTANQHGYMVMKALLFEFPSDKETWSIDKQFLLGSALLVSPALQENQTIVEAYFPEARWYDYQTGDEIIPSGRVHELYTPLEKYNLHIRGGYVIPVQQPSTTTYDSRKNPFGLIVALDENYLANGELFLDDGESYETHKNGQSTIIDFTMEKAGELYIKPRIHNYTASEMLRIKTIEIYGLDKIPSEVKVNGVLVGDQLIRQSGKIIQILSQNLTITEESRVSWMVY